ncbi:MAG: 16S rRNA (uracil(1498)-N(3))-methyltransferase [Rhizobiaceae bacterium]
MPRYDFVSQRLFVEESLNPGAAIDLDRGQSNYLINVLRLKDQAPVLLFNGRDGEWQANLQLLGRKKAALKIISQTRPQPQVPAHDLHYLFAPIKQARMEYMVQKAVEMGVSTLQPVLTEFTQLRKLNLERMAAHAVEAAEQCGILNIPEIREPMTLGNLIGNFPADRHVLFCDEGEESQNPLIALQKHATREDAPTPKLAVLIGPEGGFSPEERSQLRSLPNVTPVPLGPRVLRADTAAVAVLALVQATLGDWQD